MMQWNEMGRGLGKAAVVLAATVAVAAPAVAQNVRLYKGTLQIDKSHYEGMPRRADHPALGPAPRLEEAFLVRFPTLADLVVMLRKFDRSSDAA